MHAGATVFSVWNSPFPHPLPRFAQQYRSKPPSIAERPGELLGGSFEDVRPLLNIAQGLALAAEKVCRLLTSTPALGLKPLSVSCPVFFHPTGIHPEIPPP